MEWSGAGTVAATPPKLTYRDFLRFPDDGLRHELIGGVHYVTPSPAVVHQRLVGRLYLALSAALSESGLGEVFLAPLDVVMSKHDVVEPDVLVVLDEQRDMVSKAHVRGAPAIVIEVLSPGTRRRDDGVKRQLYERTGVREYWMVDPDRARVVVCRRDANGSFAIRETFTHADTAPLRSALVPALAIDLAALFSGRG